MDMPRTTAPQTPGDLASAIEKSLNLDLPPETALTAQTALLDAAFTTCLRYAITDIAHPGTLAMALRAQRQTMLTAAACRRMLHNKNNGTN